MGDPTLSDTTILFQPIVVSCSHYFSKIASCAYICAQTMHVDVYVSPSLCVCLYVWCSEMLDEAQ